MAKAKEKTNVMRALDALKLPYESHTYLDCGAVGGKEVAAHMAKTRKGCSKPWYPKQQQGLLLFLVPVCRELDLKKAAKCVGRRRWTWFPPKDLLPSPAMSTGAALPSA